MLLITITCRRDYWSKTLISSHLLSTMILSMLLVSYLKFTSATKTRNRNLVRKDKLRRLIY